MRIYHTQKARTKALNRAIKRGDILFKINHQYITPIYQTGPKITLQQIKQYQAPDRLRERYSPTNSNKETALEITLFGKPLEWGR